MNGIIFCVPFALCDFFFTAQALLREEEARTVFLGMLWRLELEEEEEDEEEELYVFLLGG